MNKNLLIATGFCFLASSFCMAMPSGIDAGVSENTKSLSAKSLKTENDKKLLEFKSEKNLNRLPQKAAPKLTDVITEAEGIQQYYLKANAGYFPYGDYIYYFDQVNAPGFITFGENNDVYFFDLMEFAKDTYIKGTLDGNKITVDLPQTCFTEDFEWVGAPIYYNLCVLKQEGEGSNLNFVYQEDINQVTYTIGDDGSISLDLPGTDYAIGLQQYVELENEEGGTDWYQGWAGSADFYQIFTPTDIEVIAIPEDAEVIEYRCSYEGYNYPVNVAFVDNYVYIQGLINSTWVANLTVKATIDGEKATIPYNQHVGVYRWDNEMIVVKPGKNVNGKMEYLEDTDFEFTIDQDKKVIKVADPKTYLCFVYKSDNAWLSDLLNFSVIYQDSFAGTPKHPYGLFWDNTWLKDYGYYTFGFDITPTSIENTLLLPDNLYYSIYLDGDLVLFEYDPDGYPYSHYFMLPEPTTEIPFSFNNDNDIQIWTPTEREIGIYIDGVTTMGVVAIYDYEGVRTQSELVTLDIETGNVTLTPAPEAGIDAIGAAADILKSDYYDLTGKKINNPDKGIFVKRMVLSDGSIKVVKVVK